MKVGAVFPTTLIEPEASAVRDFAQGVEQMGYDHLLAYDHVLGADPERHAPWTAAVDVHTRFHEVMVLFGFLAGITKLGLISGVMVLPQRQTALVAKQAAQIDLLSEGRLRLGVGVGWNKVEYEALGQDFTRRGRRIDEQIALLRRLWTEPSVSFAGEFDVISAAGINPLPVQRPIPVWLGGQSAPAYRRMGQLADGWLPMVPPGEEFRAAKAQVDAAAVESGRAPANIGVQVLLPYDGDLRKVLRGADAWRTAGATHLALETTGSGVVGTAEHLRILGSVSSELGLH